MTTPRTTKPFSDILSAKQEKQVDLHNAPRTLTTMKTIATNTDGKTEDEKIEILHKAVKDSQILPVELKLHDDLGKKNIKHKGLMWPTSFALQHEAAPLLLAYSTDQHVRPSRHYMCGVAGLLEVLWPERRANHPWAEPVTVQLQL